MNLLHVWGIGVAASSSGIPMLEHRLPMGLFQRAARLLPFHQVVWSGVIVYFTCMLFYVLFHRRTEPVY